MQSIIRHNHSEMNEFSGLLRIRLYALAWNDYDKRPCSGGQRTDSRRGGISPGQRASAAY